MVYHLEICKRNIKKVKRPIKLNYSQVKKIVSIDKQHFLQKNNWYIINNVVSYFKNRDDCRLLGELMSKDIIDIIGGNYGVVAADYQPIILGTEEKIGLFSPNIEKAEFAYYDLATLYKVFPELPRKYGTHTLKSFLETLRIYGVPHFKRLKQQIICLYIIDWFTHQLDRNPRNILFECDYDSNNISDISLGALIDSETSFAISSSHVIDTDFNPIWIPAIPYSNIDFKNDIQTVEGLDYNIVELLIDYPDDVLGILKALISCDFDNIAKKYSKHHNEAFYVCDDCISFLQNFMYCKQEEAEKILHL